MIIYHSNKIYHFDIWSTPRPDQLLFTKFSVFGNFYTFPDRWVGVEEKSSIKTNSARLKLKLRLRLANPYPCGSAPSQNKKKNST